MPKYDKHASSDKSVEEAQALAKGLQKPAQTKEQTKLVAQGIQKGIDLYKKQHKAKARELDKALKKAKQQSIEPDNNTTPVTAATACHRGANNRITWLPWSLLALSWLGFATFLFTQR